ncbi:gluconate transporter [Blastopirellula marina]|uniref:Gluconate transporter n=1 Tax=Blastopirellula marina TaxID=124 RepID=A0A2S8F5W1_9BACT|nr:MULTISPECIES: SLC13 family permease [Pirellulaceae]PQO27324.1 gluconate transporter [Blastopirellula marina]RCS47861.1 GntP family permease [Bremerella cremea]
MLAIVLGMVIVICGVLFLRMHAFLALFLGALAVAAATSPLSVSQSVLHRLTSGISEVQGNQIVLSDVEEGLPKKPGAYYITFNSPDGGAKQEPLVVWVDRFAEEDNVTRAFVAHELPNDIDLAGARFVSQDTYREAKQLSGSSAINRVANALGSTFGKIGILIAMASIIGQCLLSSGAAERIVYGIRHAMGERWTALAFVVSSFVLAIPVFFDTVFFLMLPLAQAMAQRSGKDYLKYVLSIVVGGTLAHSLVPPTPGPLFVATELNVSIGAMILGGIGVGIWGVIAGYFYMLWANRRWQIPLRIEAEEAIAEEPNDESDLPSFWFSVLPIVIPILLLGLKTVSQTALPASTSEIWITAISFLGDKNIALSIGALLALATLFCKPAMTWVGLSKSVQKALSEGGVVVLITCAGGAFGEVIRQTNIGAAIADSLPSTVGGTGLLVTAFMITAIIRVIQGSATVAMITAIGIVVPVAMQIGLPFHPVYLALAIGCGSKPLPWMNDSGFWVISRMSGFTEKETLKTFSVLLTIMGLVSFLATLVFAILIPLA